MYLEPWWTIESFCFGNWKFQRFSLQEKKSLRIIKWLIEVKRDSSMVLIFRDEDPVWAKKTGSGALYLNRREIYKSLLNEYF